jgi:hypothetical protein
MLQTTVESVLKKNMLDVNNRIEWDQRVAMQYTTTASIQDTKKLQPYLSYKPIEVIRKSLERTTQLARLQQSGNLQRHVKSRFTGLNQKRINEAIATDTAFSSKKNISGANCCQVFYGINYTI